MENFWPKGTTYAFEKVPELCNLRANRIKNISNIRSFQYAKHICFNPNSILKYAIKFSYQLKNIKKELNHSEQKVSIDYLLY